MYIDPRVYRSPTTRPVAAFTPHPGIRSWLVRLRDRLMAADARRRAAAHLETMPDAMLRDIGLTRYDLRHRVHGRREGQ